MCAFFGNEEAKKALRAIEMENIEAAHYRASNAYWLSKVSFVSGSLIAILPIDEFFFVSSEF
jgi:hypothetical protein